MVIGCSETTEGLVGNEAWSLPIGSAVHYMKGSEI